MGAGEDFNPGFCFDVGDTGAPAQAPWEFGGALRMALKDHEGTTTIDAKISKRLQERKGKQQQQQQKTAGASRKRQREADQDSGSEGDAAAESIESEPESTDSSGSSDEDDVMDDSSDEAADEEDSEDAPLPGELNEDSEEGDADDVSDEDDEDESSYDDQPHSQQRQQQQQLQNGQHKAGMSAAAAAAAARKAAMANGAGGHSDSDDSEGGSSGDGDEGAAEASDGEAGSEGDSEEPAPRAAAKQQQRKHQGKLQQQQEQAAGKKGSSKAGFYAETQQGFKQVEWTFQDLNLSRPLLRAVAALGYTQPTPIQAACIPLALAGRDICGSAVTGSGKTAAFTLPILERLLYRPRQVAATYVLILAPARELAAQIHSMIQKLAQFTDVDAALIVGGLSLQAQAAALRAGPAIVVATPGRIIDHVRNSQGFGLEDLAVLVLDEADRLLEMGFKDELRELLRLAPRNRQTMLFSATFSDDVQRLAALSLKSPVRLAADPTAAAPETLRQEIVRLKGSSGGDKEAVLLALASRSFASGRTIIFCETKQRAHRLKILFGLCELPPAAELHGDMTQAARLQSLEKFRKGEVAFLLATDVAARGLDILGLQVVLNYDAPRTLETYLHRVGRTARAGSEGLAVTFIADDDRALLKSVVKTGRVQLKERVVPQQAVSRWQARVEGAEPDVQRVLAEEREEAALRKAEMEANKAQNLLDHEDEIFSRPARTWFQTEKEKRSAAAAVAAAAAQGKTVLEVEAAGAGGSKASKAAAKAAAKQDKRNAKLKEKRAAEAAAGPKKKASELQTETEQFNKAIRGVKSRARALMQQGMSAKVAQKVAQKAVTGVSTSHQKKKRKTSSSANGAAAEGGLFSGDGTGKPSGGDDAAAGGKGRGSSGGSGGGKAKANLSKTDLNRLKRGGKGKGAFKSKKKFKRR